MSTDEELLRQTLIGRIEANSKRDRRARLYGLSEQLAKNNASLLQITERMSKTRSKEVENLLEVIQELVKINKELNQTANELSDEIR